MADQSDVADALRDLIAAGLYPGGTPGPDDLSTAGIVAQVTTGWPEKQHLDGMMKAGRAVVSVFSPPSMERVTETYDNRGWRTLSMKAATYTIAAAGVTVTIGGAAPATYFRQNIAALINGKAYIYTATTGQTPAQVAAGLLAAVQVDFPGATAAGAVITVPETARVEAVRVGTVGTSIRELRRQLRAFQVLVWAPSPETRKALAEGVDLALYTPAWVVLADQTEGMLIYANSHDDDGEQLQGIYRRVFLYTVEYSTTATQEHTEIVTFTLNVRDKDNTIIRTEVA